MSSRSLPRSIFLFGLLNTALGAFGLASGLHGLLRPQQTVAMAVYQQVNDLPNQSMQWLHIAMILSPISSAILLLCGIALLQKKVWGRTLAIYYGLGSIAFSLIASGINISRIADRANNPLVLNIIFSIIVSVLVGLIYKAAMVYSLTRPKVKEALVNYKPGADIIEFPLDRRD
jgi:hypothetical protein